MLSREAALGALAFEFKRPQSCVFLLLAIVLVASSVANILCDTVSFGPMAKLVKVNRPFSWSSLASFF